MEDVQVVVGGIVPPKDEKALVEAGVAHVFHPGTSLEDICHAIGSLARKRRALLEGAA
jgi:methylmalonyl-CoA mutase cobalamin-binding domain/chain